MDKDNKGGNQTVEEQEVKKLTGTEDTPTEEPEEEFDEIVYNKETVKVPKSQRQTLLQKGLNHDRIQGKAKTLETYLEKAARLTGYGSVQEYLRAVDEAERQAEAKRYESAGINDPRVVEEIIEKHPAVQAGAYSARQLAIKEQMEALKGEEFFEELRPEIEAAMLRNHALDAETVYSYLYGANRKRLTQLAKDTAAKKAVEDHKRQSKRGVEPSDDAPLSEKGLDFQPHERAWAERRVKQGHYKNLKEAWEYLRGKR